MFFKKNWIYLVAIVYILLPVDLIPDAVPILGGVDDSTVVILGLIKQYVDYRKDKNIEKD